MFLKVSGADEFINVDDIKKFESIGREHRSETLIYAETKDGESHLIYDQFSGKSVALRALAEVMDLRSLDKLGEDILYTEIREETENA